MGETIAKTGVKYDSDFIYYIKGGDVWGSPRKKPGQPKAGKASKVAPTGVELDYANYMYYVTKDGSNELVVARADRQVGGSKRKKSAKKAGSKKGGAKKGAAKKSSAKKSGKKSGGKKGKRK